MVITAYNEEKTLSNTLSEIKKLKFVDEIIVVDDGSSDNTVKKVRKLRGVNLICHPYNRGNGAAVKTGLRAASGDIIVTMDADLQDDPGEIPNLLAKLNEGYDLVSGWKKNRRDPFSKRFFSKIYNYFTSKLSGLKLHDFNCGLKAYRKDVINNIKIYGELHRYLPVIAFHKGFKVTEISVTHHHRKYGKSKFGSARFTRGAFDLITITFLTKYNKRPLHLFGLLGLVSFLLGSIISIVLAYQRIFQDQYLSSRPILFLGVLLIIIGVQFITLGLLGEMITAQKQDGESYSIKHTIGLES